MSGRADEEFRRKYPNLAGELGSAGTIGVNAARTSAEEAEKAGHFMQGYQPTAVDFIRRCKNDAQALEIINFLETKGEIEPGYAKRLRVQLAERGIRSFGKRRQPGCYERGDTG